MIETSDNPFSELENQLKANRLWMKLSPFEPKSLFKAISNSIYFSKTHHEKIKQKAMIYFLTNVRHFFSEFNLFDFDIVDDFVHNMTHPRYQNWILEITGQMCKRRIELYHFENKILRFDSYSVRYQKTLRLIRLDDGHYSALFPIDWSVKVVVAQNIVLSLIDQVLNGLTKGFTITDVNNGKFENYEYIDWLENSLSQQSIRSSCSFHPLPVDSIPPKHNPIEASKTNPDFNINECNLGNKILNLFQERRRKSSLMSISEKSQAVDSNYHKLLLELEEIARNKANKYKKPKAIKMRKSSQNEERESNIPESCFSVDLFSEYSDHQDFETILWNYFASNESKPFQPRLGMNRLTNIPAIRFKSEAHSSSSFSLNSTESFAHYPNKHIEDASFIHDKLCQFKTVYDEIDDDFSPPKESKEIKYQSQSHFKKPIKLSISENFAHIYKNHQPDSFDSENVKKAPNDISPRIEPKSANAKESKKAKKKQEKEKGEQKFHRGYLKFFDEKNNFGFMSTKINDKAEDVFVYRSEFDLAGIEMTTVRMAKYGTMLTFEFTISSYYGKYQRSKKASNIRLVELIRPESHMI